MKSLLKNIVVYLLTLEAKLVLKKYRPKIVAVTGSVGKTSTKDAIFSVFSKFFYARKSVKSFNSEIGLPLTILGCPNGWNNPFIWLKNIYEGLILILTPNHYPKWLILEIGVDRPGDIEKVSRWLPIDIAVFTTMGSVPVHVEFFDSPEALFKEKMKLVDALVREGVIIFNQDDEVSNKFLEPIREYKKISYGFDKNAEIKGSDYKIKYDKSDIQFPKPTGINFRVNQGNSSLQVNLKGTLGKHYIYSFLAAISSSISQDINLVKVIEALGEYIPPPGRMRILDGIKGSTIIDDTYNSSPIALFEALSVLDQLKILGRKITVLGDMMELGKYSVEEHKKAGSIAACFSDYIFTVGIRSHYIYEAVIEAGFPEDLIFQFEADEARLAGKRLELLLQKGDVVLIKGSQSIRLEKAVEEVMAVPEKKEELLARQEKEWQKK